MRDKAKYFYVSGFYKRVLGTLTTIISKWNLHSPHFSCIPEKHYKICDPGRSKVLTGSQPKRKCQVDKRDIVLTSSWLWIKTISCHASVQFLKIKTQAAIIEFLSYIRFIIQTHHLKQELWDHFCRQLHSRLARQRREHLPCHHQLET